MVFHNDEGHGRARGFWRGRPDYFGAPQGMPGRGYGDHTPHGGPDPRQHHDGPEDFGPGMHAGRAFGRGHFRGPAGRGGMGWFAREFFGPARAQVRRGDVRAAILVLLAEEPMHGYQIIQALSERSGGVWRPSAGSVYPTLQQLEDEGLVRGEEKDGRNVFELTDEGRKAAEAAAKNPMPWNVTGADEAAGLFGLFMPLGNAVAEVARTGSPETIAKARAILTDARRSLYRLLAEDEPTDPAEPDTTAE